MNCHSCCGNKEHGSEGQQQGISSTVSPVHPPSNISSSLLPSQKRFLSVKNGPSVMPISNRIYFFTSFKPRTITSLKPDQSVSSCSFMLVCFYSCKSGPPCCAHGFPSVLKQDRPITTIYLKMGWV